MFGIKKEYTDFIEQWIEEHSLTKFFVSHVSLAFFYGIFLFLYEIKFLRDLVPKIHPVLIAWALMIIMYDVLVQKIWKKIPYWKILYLFILVAGITTVINYEAGIVSNIKSWIMVTIPLCVFYPVCLILPEKERKGALLKSLLGAAIVVFFASSIALGMYFARISETVSFMGMEELIGFRHYVPDDPSSATLLYGIYVDTNHAAIYALTFAAFSLFMIFGCGQEIYINKRNEIIGKTFAIVNLIVQICYFPLANSRGGWLCLFFAGVVTVFLYLYCTRFKHLKGSKKIITSIVLAVVSMTVLCGGILCLRTSLSYLSTAISTGVMEENREVLAEESSTSVKLEDQEESIIQGATTVQDELVEEKTVQDTFTKQDNGSGAGRLAIWKEALDLFKFKPVFGTGAGNNQYFAQKYEVESVKLVNGAALHNSYLDLLVDYGVIGALIMFSFLVCNLWAVLKKIWNHGEEKKGAYYGIGFSVLLIGGASVFLSCLFISTTAMYFIILTMIGYLMSQN